MAERASLRPEVSDVFDRLEACGGTQRELAAAIGIEENKISKVKAGERQLKAHELLRARDWLKSREAGAVPDQPRTVGASADDETVEIAQMDLSFSMGPGTTIDDYIEETSLRFDLDYIRGFTRTPAHRLRIARGVGESMSPTLLSSDMVWIDTTQTMLNLQDRVWAVSLFGAAAIKRLRLIGEGKVMVISDNAAVENQVVDASDLIIGGRVIRFARDL